MPIHYDTGIVQERMTAVIDGIDSHATVEGYLEIGDGTVSPWTFGNSLVKIELEDPSFDAPTPVGMIAMHITAPKTGLDGIATTSGTATVAQIRDGGDVVRVNGLVVGTAIAPGVEIALASTTITAGQTVTVTQGRITHSPGLV